MKYWEIFVTYRKIDHSLRECAENMQEGEGDDLVSKARLDGSSYEV